MKHLILISITVFSIVACGDNVELRQGIDPITGKKYKLQQSRAGAWDIYTHPNAKGEFIMISRDGKPVITVSGVESPSPLIVVHDPSNSNLSIVELSNSENRGPLNRIHFYSDKPNTTIHEAVKNGGRWVYKELKSKESNSNTK